MSVDGASARTEERDVDVCVVGAGPHGLAIVAHLVTARPSLRDRIAVVDPSGRWLDRWRSQLARLEIDVLRSPIVHHPDVDPGALARYVATERLPRSGLRYDPPLASTFDRFCSNLIDRLGLGGLPIAAGVWAIRPGATATTVATDCGTLRARHLVWTGNTAHTIVPTPFADAATTSAVVEHGARVDLRTINSVPERRIVVVGGGLTAGHLAAGAAARGAVVTLVTRRPIVERDFDVEPGWLGPRHLDGYRRRRSPARRLDVAHAARGGGSMPEWMCRRLTSEVEAGRLTHLVGQIDGIDLDGDRGRITIDGRVVIADRCWLATGTRPDCRADPALAAVVDRHIDGVPVVDSSLRIPGGQVFMSGRLAAVELGPAAGNLWGARMAARRVCRSITGVDLDALAMVRTPPVSDESGGGR